MRLLKVTALLLLWPVFFVRVSLVHLASSLFGLSNRWIVIAGLTGKFSTAVRRILNVRVVVKGDRPGLYEGGHLILSNHLGYLDGIVLGSLFPVIYVSKQEVKGWPFIGRWVKLIGTIFVDRKNKEKVLLVVEEIVERLKGKNNVLLFPEGTSTNGETLLPFQSSFFAAPLMARATVVAVTLAYTRVGHEPLTCANRDRVYWYGEMEFAGHFWNLLALPGIEVSVTIHPKIETADYQNDSVARKKLALACHRIIAGDATRRDQTTVDRAFPLNRHAISDSSIRRRV